ncbi:MAG: hypothetical protein ABI717_03470 [Actinomycetota bacterium]
MNLQIGVRCLAFAGAAMCAAALAPLAAGDAVYHSEHLNLAPVGGAPLRSGFVQNIKAEGPRVYAHEVFVLNGAVLNATYTVTRNFFFLDPRCAGGSAFRSPVATLQTNAAGNGREDVFVRPSEVPPAFRGVHGVIWTVTDSAGAVVYQTTCTAVTLD